MDSINLEGQILSEHVSHYGLPFLEMFPEPQRRSGTIIDIHFRLEKAEEDKSIIDPEFSGQALVQVTLDQGLFGKDWVLNRNVFEYLDDVFLRSRRNTVPSRYHGNRYTAWRYDRYIWIAAPTPLIAGEGKITIEPLK